MLGNELRKKSKKHNKMYKDCIKNIELQLKKAANDGKLFHEIKIENISYPGENLDSIIRYFEKNLIDVRKVDSYFGGSLIFKW